MCPFLGSVPRDHVPIPNAGLHAASARDTTADCTSEHGKRKTKVSILEISWDSRDQLGFSGFQARDQLGLQGSKLGISWDSRVSRVPSILGISWDSRVPSILGISWDSRVSIQFCQKNVQGFLYSSAKRMYKRFPRTLPWNVQRFPRTDTPCESGFLELTNLASPLPEASL